MEQERKLDQEQPLNLQESNALYESDMKAISIYSNDSDGCEYWRKIGIFSLIVFPLVFFMGCYTVYLYATENNATVSVCSFHALHNNSSNSGSELQYYTCVNKTVSTSLHLFTSLSSHFIILPIELSLVLFEF
jgi:hypothetical protein